MPFGCDGFEVPYPELYFNFHCSQWLFATYWFHPVLYLPHIAIEQRVADPTPLTVVIGKPVKPMEADLSILDCINRARHALG